LPVYLLGYTVYLFALICQFNYTFLQQGTNLMFWGYEYEPWPFCVESKANAQDEPHEFGLKQNRG
jgi:hypothetical protein